MPTTSATATMPATVRMQATTVKQATTVMPATSNIKDDRNIMTAVAFPRNILYRERLQQQNGDMRKRDKL